jgi:hypothetical protein
MILVTASLVTIARLKTWLAELLVILTKVGAATPLLVGFSFVGFLLVYDWRPRRSRRLSGFGPAGLIGIAKSRGHARLTEAQ